MSSTAQQQAAEQERKFADDLISKIDLTFQRAYYAHINGVSETELLIDFDIEAAWANVDKHIVSVGRKTIKSAVSAVDKRLPFDLAHQYLVDRLHKRVDTIIRKREQQRAMDQN
jgi:hypothetical protein